MEKYNKEDLKGIGEGYFEAKWKYKMKAIRWFLFWFIGLPVLLFIILMIFLFASSNGQNTSAPSSLNTANTSATGMTDNEAESFFHATEIASNQLPNSVSFWTEADCPGAAQYAYTVPAGYSLNSCQNGDMGSHGGCPTCIMSQISLNSD